MHCGICNRAKTSDIPFFCCHCINASPNLLLRDKIKMLEVRREVDALRERVDEELMKGFEGVGKLGKHLQLLDIHNEQRRLQRIAHREEQFKNRLKKKRKLLQDLQEVVEDDSASSAYTFPTGIDDVVNEEKCSLKMMSQVLDKNQTEVFTQLQAWFIIDKCEENPLFPYRIWNIPLINIKNSNRMDKDIMASSISYLRQYVSLALRIWLFDISDSLTNDQDAIMEFSRLVYDVLRLLKVRNLVSNSVSIRDILVRYDLDGMVYHLYQNCFLKSLEDVSNAYPPTLSNIRDLIATIIPSS